MLDAETPVSDVMNPTLIVFAVTPGALAVFPVVAALVVPDPPGVAVVGVELLELLEHPEAASASRPNVTPAVLYRMCITRFPLRSSHGQQESVAS